MFYAATFHLSLADKQGQTVSIEVARIWSLSASHLDKQAPAMRATLERVFQAQFPLARAIQVVALKAEEAWPTNRELLAALRATKDDVTRYVLDTSEVIEVLIEDFSDEA